MRTVLNLLWLVLSGVWLAIGYAVAGARAVHLDRHHPLRGGLFPACRVRALAVRSGRGAQAGGGHTLHRRNVLWFVLAGLWMALAHLFLGVLLCLTVIGIPLGLGNFKLAAVAIAPLGKEVVPTSDPRAQAGAVVF
jgi:uncharacterized membrane protein YccF (DUF307 family)